jgi:hypothetical protein
MKLVLTEHPISVHSVGSRDSRPYVISRTPFSVAGRLRPGRIEVLSIFDNRSGAHPEFM